MRSLLLGLLASAAVPFVPVNVSAQSYCVVPQTYAVRYLSTAAPRLETSLYSRPAPMARVHTQGTLPHQGIRDISLTAEKQLTVMRDAAYLWSASGDDAYLGLAERYLNAWVKTYRPSFNPIDETNFDALIQTYDIIAPDMDSADRLRAQRFLRNWGQGYVRAMDNPGHLTGWDKNWQSHRIKLLTLIAVALNDRALFDDARRFFRLQVGVNIAADGEVADFAQRDAVHYVIYDLDPLLQAAMAARMNGEDWYHYKAPRGGSLARAVAWVRPYADGRIRHQEFVHSTVAFDAERAAAGQKSYSGPFQPATAGKLMWMASTFDASYQPLARRLQPNPPPFMAACGG